MRPFEFLALVAEMRATQIAYFKHRGTQTLIRAKELETAVDDELRELLAPTNEAPPIETDNGRGAIIV
jgi:hypothetical protein